MEWKKIFKASSVALGGKTFAPQNGVYYFTPPVAVSGNFALGEAGDKHLRFRSTGKSMLEVTFYTGRSEIQLNFIGKREVETVVFTKTFFQFCPTPSMVEFEVVNIDSSLARMATFNFRPGQAPLFITGNFGSKNSEKNIASARKCVLRAARILAELVGDLNPDAFPWAAHPAGQRLLGQARRNIFLK